MFNVDFKRLAIHLLPTFFRQPLMFGMLRAALAPVETLYAQFLDKRAAQIYRISHNGQTCYLQAALNDRFDPSERRIRVLTLERQGEWLYAVTENGGTDIPVATAEGEEITGVPIVYDEQGLTAEQNNFVVYLPQTVWETRLEAVRQLVDTYKLMSKRAIYTPQSVVQTTAAGRRKFDDILKEYKRSYITPTELSKVNKEQINIISNADSRIHK